MPANSEIRLTPEVWDSIIRQVETAYHRRAWHGKNLTSALKGLNVETAYRIPVGRKVSIAQIAVHAAYWKYRVRCRLVGEKGKFPRTGSDWLPPRANPSLETWREDLALLDSEHELLVERLREIRDGVKSIALPLDEAERMAFGAAHHDIYHASQISQWRKLLGDV